jgi:hypothetical protein
MSRDKVARDCGTLPTGLLYHCEDDSTVPASHSKDFHAALIDADRGSKRNLVCTLALDKKGWHAGVIVYSFTRLLISFIPVLKPIYIIPTAEL